ncbi:MAG: hybrid sensor histidine kinase/response regulator [Bacteroidota bacterium]
MSDNENKSGGFALLCNQEGMIEQVVRDDLGLGDETPEETLFIDLMDPGSRIKSMNFLHAIKSKEVAFDHQLNVWTGDILRTLSFVGVRLKDKLLVIAANNEDEAVEFTRNLQDINNEQANIIRRLMKEKSEMRKSNARAEEFSYDDLSALNNELVNLQRELARKNAELERVNDLKNQFLGMAAHDLRNPLAIIHTQAQLLIDRASDDLPPNHMKFLNNIYSTAEFMLRLVEDLLDVSKIESGKLELNLKTFNLVDLARNNVGLNQVLADRRNIRLDLNNDTDPVYIQGDWHKLEQVFNNLISNAIKFSPSDSSVRIIFEVRNRYVRVSVEDKGQGIPSENLEHIFEPFQKTGVSEATEEKGTGLGLNIARRIIEGHQGEIWVESEEGKGSVFRFTLPLTDVTEDTGEHKSASQDEKASATPSWEDKTLLLVEDDLASLKLMEEMLKPLVGSIISCTHGSETLEALSKNDDIDLILLDIGLPDIDGRKLIRKIREINTQIPVIVQTALTMVKDKESILEAGADEFLTKPIDHDVLLDQIEKHVGV